MPKIDSELSASALGDPPKATEVEISIFGPGKGESVLMHLGDNEWIVVDSCIDSRDGSLPALAYLERIGVDAASRVRMIVATHAHDDHISGMARLVDICKSACFVASQAIDSSEFFSLLENDAQLEREYGVRRTVLKEYRAVLDILQNRGVASVGQDFKRALQERPLFSSANGSSVVALAPSDKSVTRSLKAIAATLLTAGSTPRVAYLDPNELSVALWVQTPLHSFLLGGDLTAGPEGCGWSAILDFYHPDSLASVFKVPHHGSPNSHHDDIWSNLLTPEPICLLAPFRAGPRPRPDTADRARILRFTPNAFITADPEAQKLSKAGKRLSRSLGALSTNVRDPWGIPGHVRARALRENDWIIDLVAPARRVTA